MAVKPLVRWTIGGSVPEKGFKSLRRSIELWKRTYGDEFDYVLCHNIPVENFGIETVDQCNFCNTLPYEPKDTFWKFCPPRMRPESHEIIIDNDLLVYNRCPTIDWFLSQTDQVISTAAHKAYHGCFEPYLFNCDIAINTGLVGFPPGYDFESDLKKLFVMYPLPIGNHCDDQGAFLMLTKRFLKVVPMDEIHVCNPDTDFATYKLGICGTHFAGLNQGHDQFWDRMEAENAL